MLRRIAVILIISLAALMPAPALAQGERGGETDGLLLRAGGDLVLAENERVETVIVAGGDAVIDGTVTEALIVAGGDAVVNGRVEGDIVMFGGDLTLASTSHVNDVTSFNGDVTREQGAVVDGEIEESAVAWVWITSIILVGAFVMLAVLLLIAAAIFAGVAGRQLTRTSELLTSDVGPSVLGAVIVWVGLPILAALLFVTVIGIPVALGILLVAMPALWFLGVIVSGTRLGRAILSRGVDEGGRPFAPALLGTGILILIALIPFAGALILLLAGVYGSGALVAAAFNAVRGGGEPVTTREHVAPQQPESPA